MKIRTNVTSICIGAIFDYNVALNSTTRPQWVIGTAFLVDFTLCLPQGNLLTLLSAS